ncbi:polycomb group protein FIE2 [Iris pallida]|uniref:Polycomb group protein FIE2 n=1 Tax=Iris pallida TaxID=29817 RepID=A0AAX6G2B3_IRIPA|nr:polycomb group protein FIE2 [Iris pallida]
MSFVGHGDSINEILTQALKPSLVISASKVFIASFHSNFVDYNRWLGDFILSKSVDSEIVPWKPKTMEQSPGRSVDILQKYLVPEYDIWFIKFKEGDISYLRSVRLTCEILYTSPSSIYPCYEKHSHFLRAWASWVANLVPQLTWLKCKMAKHCTSTLMKYSWQLN